MTDNFRALRYLAQDPEALRVMAELVRKAGERESPRDTVLAHITPAEAELLQARGGSGRILSTGLPSFDDGGDGGDSGGPGGGSTGSDDSSDSGMSGPDGGGPGADGGQDGGSWGGDNSSSGGTSLDDAAKSMSDFDSKDTDGYSYGQYTGADFSAYGWGDPTVGYQASPTDTASAYQAKANIEAQAKSMADFDTRNYDPADMEAAIAAYSATASMADFDTKDVDPAQNDWGWAHSLASFVSSAPVQIAGALLGVGPITSALGLAGNLYNANYGKAGATIGGAVAGAPGAVIGSIVGNITQGNTTGALGTALNAGVNASGSNLGQALAGNLDRGSLEQALAGTVGNSIQGAAINSVASGLAGALNGSAYSTGTANSNVESTEGGASSGTASSAGAGSTSASSPSGFSATVSPSVTTELGTGSTSSSKSGASSYGAVYPGGVDGAAPDEDAAAYRRLAQAISGRKAEQQAVMNKAAQEA